MRKLAERSDGPLFRLIVPASPELNIFTRVIEKTTPLGPVIVATAVSECLGWRAEVVDENNYRLLRDENGFPDHKLLQRENPASVVGFYCGLTSTMNRVFELARFYHEQGVINIAGGWHAHYRPEEMLDNGFDIVVHGDGEVVIQQMLAVLRDGGTFADIPGISFWEGGAKKTNAPEMLEAPDLNTLPHPNFDLVYGAHKIEIYPINGIRGCPWNCEFCSVKGRPRRTSARHLFDVVNRLVETRKAKKFFIVDDRTDEGSIEFFEMIAKKYGDSLHLTVQIRLEAAENIEFLEVMKKAGVRIFCVGYESPIDEDLKAMRKGYSSRQMIDWTRILRRYAWVHGMFIYGYPPLRGRKSSGLSAQEMADRFKMFIRKTGMDSIQVLHPIPIVGSDLRTRLEKEGRVFPLELVPWSRYDGNYICFMPEGMGMTLQEMQETPIQIMSWFYDQAAFWRMLLWTIPLPFVFVIGLVAGRRYWRTTWLREVVRHGGHRVLRRWQKRQGEDFLSSLENYKS